MSDRLSLKPGMDERLAAQVYGQSRRLFRVAFGILRDAASAEDVCQQAFLKAWERQAELRSTEALAGWLTQTVIHESLALYRRRRTERRVLANHGRAKETLKADASGASEQREKVLAGVSELAEPIRTIVVLRLLEGVSGNDVGAILEISAVEVSRRLHEGMAILRTKWRSWQLTGDER